jgi:hypothetical protein
MTRARISVTIGIKLLCISHAGPELSPGVFYLQIPGLGEGPEAAVVGFLDVVGKTAARQLFAR